MRLFSIGQCVATTAALERLATCGISPLGLVRRHASGDFGDLCSDDIAANLHAVKARLRILSKYAAGNKCVYVITEADRSATCILLVEEY